MNHTPTPYRIGNINSVRQSVRILDSHGFLVAEGRAAGGPFKIARGNADFIVRACNAHDDLVEALEMLMQTCQEEGHLIRLASYRQAESALKLAYGE